MSNPELPNKSKGINRNDVIGWSILIATLGISIWYLPISFDNAISSMKERINNAKTCSDVFSADIVPFGASSMVQMFDNNNSIKNLLDKKAHQLCKPLYDLQKKYGDLQVSDLPKMSCDDMAILIKTIPTRQEVINQYVLQCQIDKIPKLDGVKQ